MRWGLVSDIGYYLSLSQCQAQQPAATTTQAQATPQSASFLHLLRHYIFRGIISHSQVYNLYSRRKPFNITTERVYDRHWISSVGLATSSVNVYIIKTNSYIYLEWARAGSRPCLGVLSSGRPLSAFINHSIYHCVIAIITHSITHARHQTPTQQQY